MADLRTDYKDDVLDTEINEERKYEMIENSDGTVSLKDVTEYLQLGDIFGAEILNQIVAKITTDVIDALEGVLANTEDGVLVGANAVKELKNILQTAINTKLPLSGGQITGNITGTSNNAIFSPDGNIHSDLWGGWLSSILHYHDTNITDLITRFPKTCRYVPNNDWNNAVETGFYMGYGYANAPLNGTWFMGITIAHNTNYVVQEVWHFSDGAGITMCRKFSRRCYEGTWFAWVQEPQFTYDASTGTLDITL